MPFDDGIDWGGGPGANGVNIEVEAASTPKTGVIRVLLDKGTPAELAEAAAAEWNARKPIDNVCAIAYNSLTRFLHPGGTILGIAVTFDGKVRKLLEVGQSEASVDCAVTITRVKTAPVAQSIST